MGNIECIKRKEDSPSSILKEDKDDPYSFEASVRRMTEKMSGKSLSDSKLMGKKSTALISKKNGKLDVIATTVKTDLGVSTPKVMAERLQPRVEEYKQTPKSTKRQKSGLEFNELIASEFKQQKRSIMSKISNCDTSEDSSEGAEERRPVRSKFAKKVYTEDTLDD